MTGNGQAPFPGVKALNLYGGLFEHKPTLGLGFEILGAKLQFAYSPENKSILAGSLFW